MALIPTINELHATWRPFVTQVLTTLLPAEQNIQDHSTAKCLCSPLTMPCLHSSSLRAYSLERGLLVESWRAGAMIKVGP